MVCMKQVDNTLQVGTKNWKTSTLTSVYRETLGLLSNVINIKINKLMYDGFVFTMQGKKVKFVNATK